MKDLYDNIDQIMWERDLAKAEVDEKAEYERLKLKYE
jgi:hypothetical protein